MHSAQTARDWRARAVDPDWEAWGRVWAAWVGAWEVWEAWVAPQEESEESEALVEVGLRQA